MPSAAESLGRARPQILVLISQRVNTGATAFEVRRRNSHLLNKTKSCQFHTLEFIYQLLSMRYLTKIK